MNREMRRHGEEMGLPEWMYDNGFDLWGDWADSLLSRELQDEDYEWMKYQAMKDQFMLEERPEDDYGVVSWFAASFVYPAMEDAFAKAAVEFLWNEPMTRDRGLFQEVVIPFNMSKSVKGTFIAAVLSMMLICARQGSGYAAQIIINLYKTFYKEEYNVFKRIHRLDAKMYADAFYKEGMEEDEHQSLSARLTVMGELLDKEIDPSWNFVYAAMNDHVFKSRMIWRVAETVSHNEEIQNKQRELYAESTEWVIEHFPEMVLANVQGEEEEYSILSDIWAVVENAVEKQGASEVLLSRRGEFDVFAYACEVADICRKHMEEGKEDPDKVILFAVIYFVAESYGKLYVEREKEILSILGVQRREIVKDEYLEEEGIPREEILKSRSKEDKEDPRMKKLMRIMETLQVPKKVNGAKVTNGQKVSQEMEDTSAGQEKKESERDSLCKLLAEKELRLKEAERKAQIQRELYEESRAREKALEKMIAKQEGEHAELIALREFVYKLEQKGTTAEENNSGRFELEKMTEVLRERSCAIIGGQDNWISKMKRLLPSWVFISVNDSLNLDRVLGNVEAAFLFTDTLSHKMYYRMMNTIKDRKIPFHYIHGVNVEKVILAMYKELIGENDDVIY